LLGLLLRNAGRLVTRDEIQQALWDDSTHVDFDQGINQCVRQVRAALDDVADSPRFIETVPRRGYRFIALVTPAESAEPTPPPAPDEDDVPEPRDSWRGPLLAFVIVGLALASVVGVAWQPGERLSLRDEPRFQALLDTIERRGVLRASR
jgi:hypothetical protein